MSPRTTARLGAIGVVMAVCAPIAVTAPAVAANGTSTTTELTV